MRAANLVEPSLIRVEADEVTYHLHVFLRFELELALLRGDLAVDDLPAAWNERMRNLVGIEVPNDGVGVLQDVHWSAGLVGYFPTYTLGTLYSAQFLAAIERELGPIDAIVRAGEYDRLLGMDARARAPAAARSSRPSRSRATRPARRRATRPSCATCAPSTASSTTSAERAAAGSRRPPAVGLVLDCPAEPLEPLEVRQRLGQREALLVEAELAAPDVLHDVVGAARRPHRSARSCSSRRMAWCMAISRARAAGRSITSRWPG